MIEGPSIRLVAIDLDGTLLDDARQVSDRTAQALRCLPSRGVKVVIASARPPRSVRHVYRSLGLDTWQINYNGAMIWDEPAWRIVFHQPIEGELVLRIVEHARKLLPELLVSCEVSDRWYTDRLDHRYTTETGRLFEPDGVMSIEEMCRDPVTKLLLLADPARIEPLAPVLADAFPAARFVHSDPELIQVMDAAVSKATALRRVAEHYDLAMRDVMAIGDARNDIPMLQSAGVAVAMDNAAPEVKRVAHWVAPSNNDHGVHAALQWYGLC